MPSIAIAIGLVTLVIVIGIPYAWFRLSVIGSVSYELMASNMALSALKLDLANADADAFGLIYVGDVRTDHLTVLANIFVCKPMHLGTMRVGSGDKKWGALSQTTFMTALLVVLIVPMIFGGLVGLLTFVTSALIAVVVSMLAKKTGAKWDERFHTCHLSDWRDGYVDRLHEFVGIGGDENEKRKEDKAIRRTVF